MSTKKTRTTKKPPTLQVLDENTSALVICEYLGMQSVKTKEIDALTAKSATADARGIAVAFRMSDILGIPDPFKINPRFRIAFERARMLMNIGVPVPSPTVTDEARS